MIPVWNPILYIHTYIYIYSIYYGFNTSINNGFTLYIYPLVNSHVTMERSTMLSMGKSTTSMAIFNSESYHPMIPRSHDISAVVFKKSPWLKPWRLISHVITRSMPKLLAFIQYLRSLAVHFIFPHFFSTWVQMFISSSKLRKCLDLLNGSPVPRWSPHGLSKALGRPLQQLLHLLLLFFQLLKGQWNQQGECHQDIHGILNMCIYILYNHIYRYIYIYIQH